MVTSTNDIKATRNDGLKKKIHNKIHTSYYFDDLTNIKIIDLDNFLLVKKFISLHAKLHTV